MTATLVNLVLSILIVGINRPSTVGVFVLFLLCCHRKRRGHRERAQIEQ